MNIENKAQFEDLLSEALGGSYRAQGVLKEAISSSDLKNWFLDFANAEIEEQYPRPETTWQKYATLYEVNDFRPSALYELAFADSSNLQRENGGITRPAGTLPLVPELTPYATFEYKSGEKFVNTKKNGVRIHWSFEAFINDQWGEIASLPAEMTQMAVNTDDYLAATMLVDPNGINTANFNVASGNILLAGTGVDPSGATTTTPDNAPLSLDSLRAAIAQASKTSVNEGIATVSSFVLAVAPGRKTYAELLTNTQKITQTINGAQYEYTPSLGASVEVVEIPWISTIAGANGEDIWFLLPAGGRVGTRRTIVRTSLRGRGVPEIRVNSNTGYYLGGGAVPHTEGSFDNDDSELRLRQFGGAGYINPIGQVASWGDGRTATP